MEHWSWMQQQPAPEEKPRIAQDLAEAVAFELVHSSEEMSFAVGFCSSGVRRRGSLNRLETGGLRKRIRGYARW